MEVFEIPLCQENIVGKGGNGNIYKANFNGEMVAIKRVELTNIVSDQREDKALQKLQHLNIVKLIHLEDSGYFRYYVLELCNASLEKLFLRSENPRKYSGPIPSKIQVLLQLATGLEFIHKNGIVHRNIKPENVLILVGDDGQVLMKWADFGLSKRLTERVTYSMTGFPEAKNWIAPEILKILDENDYAFMQKHATIKSDIYAAGLVFAYFLLDGHRHPFGSRCEILYNIVENKLDMSCVEKIGSKHLQRIICLMLEYKPEERSTALDILSSLNCI